MHVYPNPDPNPIRIYATFYAIALSSRHVDIAECRWVILFAEVLTLRMLSMNENKKNI